MSVGSSLLRFKFEKFDDLPHEKGKSVWSKEEKDASGRGWKLNLYPGGDSRASDSNDPSTSLYLYILGEVEVNAKTTFIVNYGEENEVTTPQGKFLYKKADSSWGQVEWIKRSNAIDMLNNEGSLLIHVLIQIIPSATYRSPDPLVSNLLALFDGEVGSDVTFKVGEDLIHAHTAIIRANSEVLWDCIENNESAEVLVEGISKDAFIAFLRCFYGASISVSLSVEVLKDIIVAADRFNVPQIKIAAETSLVEDCIVNDENVCEWYEFSHRVTCPLLKEQAASYFILRASALLRSPRSDQLKQSPQLMAELMMEMSDRVNGTGDTMGVNGLRKELADKGLDVDGSKEILRNRLQSSKEESGEEESGEEESGEEESGGE